MKAFALRNIPKIRDGRGMRSEKIRGICGFLTLVGLATILVGE